MRHSKKAAIHSMAGLKTNTILVVTTTISPSEMPPGKRFSIECIKTITKVKTLKSCIGLSKNYILG